MKNFLNKILEKGKMVMFSKQYKPYVIIDAYDVTTLVTNINNFLEKNTTYKPLGGVCISKGRYYQALYCEASSNVISE